MITYSYQAKDKTNNKVVKGSLKAESERVAGKLLLEQNLIPLSIIEQNKNESFLAKLSNTVTLKDKLVFTRQLATLIGAGLPLAQSLHTVYEQTQSKKLKSIIGDIISNIESGHTLADSFSAFPEVFDKLYLAIIRAGEASGTLDDSLQRIAAQQEKDAAMMSKIKGAMTYPAIVLLVIFGVMGFMMFKVVPQVVKLYQDMRLELPMLTKIMMSITNFFTNFWWLVLIAIGVSVYFFKQYIQTDAGKKSMDAFKLNVPMFSKLFRKMYMARFARTGQTLLLTGVPMLDTLDITSQAVNNFYVAKSITAAADKVKSGKPLSVGLKGQEYIIDFIPQMIKIGEQSGRIDEMLGKAAQVYEDELDEEIKAISTMIEPILMVVLAIVAGGMVGAILFPIYSMVNNIRV